MVYEAGEILFCTLTCEYKGKKIVFERVVYKVGNGFFSRKRYLDSRKIKEPVKVLKIDLIKKLGQEMGSRKESLK